MKQYLDPQQTAKLIGLGFERPKSYTNEASFLGCGFTYSIGELIEMLPRRINGHNGIIDLYRNSIDYNTSDDILSLHQRGEFYLRCAQGELIDAIYEVLVKLKEEGVV
jgi:hypothetical protein